MFNSDKNFKDISTQEYLYRIMKLLETIEERLSELEKENKRG